MATAGEVMAMLIPTGGWITRGESYEDVEFLECEPISKQEFEAGFAQYDSWKIEQETKVAASKQALLDKLGITADEAKLLLS